MSYSDFSLETLRRNFGLVVRDQLLFEPIGVLAPSPWLVQTLAYYRTLPFISEKARSEFLVAPILVACREMLGNKVQIFSGVQLEVDPDKGLKGECDFILARSASTFVLEAPLMVIVEAKKQDIEEGLGQCAAQMLGAQLYNDKEGHPVPFLYGCVTTGEMWQFLKLDKSAVLIHPERFPLGELTKILWFLTQCFQDVDRCTAAAA